MRTDELIQAAKEGRADAVARALEEDPALAGARGETGETPLMAALYRGHHDVVAALIDRGAPIDIFAAAALGRMDDLDRALGSDAAAARSVAYDGWTPLHLAAFFGRTEAIGRLLDAGAGMTAASRNSMRNTPLHAAAAGNHTEAALLLLDRGAPVNVVDAGGHTPLHIAAESGNLEIVKALLARGADAMAVDGEDRTPLARAAARNHDDVIDAINLAGTSGQ